MLVGWDGLDLVLVGSEVQFLARMGEVRFSRPAPLPNEILRTIF